MTKLLGLVFTVILSGACAGEQVEDNAAAGSSYAGRAQLDLLAGELPEALQAAYDLDSEGSELDLPTQRALYEFGVTHPTDARPWLLLAHDAMRSETYSFAVRYYDSAIKADPRAAQQQGLLGDVLHIVRVCGGAAEQKEARELVASYYGAEAAQAVKDALALTIAEQDSAGADRLRDLLEQVQPEPQDPVRLAPACFARVCGGTVE